MSASTTPAQDRLAQKLRSEGWTLERIERKFGVGPSVARRMCGGVQIDREPSVAYDRTGRCWRIYIYQLPTTGDDPQHSINRWPCMWTCFATKGAGESHLVLHRAKYLPA